MMAASQIEGPIMTHEVSDLFVQRMESAAGLRPPSASPLASLPGADRGTVLMGVLEYRNCGVRFPDLGLADVCRAPVLSPTTRQRAVEAVETAQLGE